MDSHLMKVRQLEAQEKLSDKVEAMDRKLDAILAVLKPAAAEPAHAPESTRSPRNR